MPFLTINHVRLFYRLEGPPDAPVLAMSHSLGCDHGMWAPQLPDFIQHFQVLRYDTRGHGASDVPPGDYTLEQLGSDALGLLDALNISRFAFCGLSMGGAVGQWLAVNAPQRMTALVLANTSARFDAASLEARRQTVLAQGLPAVVDAVMQRFFSPETLARGDGYANAVRSVLLNTNPEGYARCCAALRDFDFSSMLGKIEAPVLVIGGDRDGSTPWAAHGELLVKGIHGAKEVHLPAAHISSIERPRSFTAAVLEFLLQTGDGSGDPLQKGFQMRRRVLGEDHVKRAAADVSDFNHDFQLFLTRYAWGSIWTRPGLDHRTRRLLVFAVTAALGRWEEFRLHVRAALAHGLEPCDLKEVLLQLALYAGVPAANTGFMIAWEELENLASTPAHAG